MNRSSYPLKLPASLKKAAQRLADEDGVSLNQFICVAIAEKVGALEAADAFFRERAAGATGAGLRRFVENAPDVPPVAQDALSD
jgi:hypothetical protein